MSRLTRLLVIAIVLSLCLAGLAAASFTQTAALKFGSATTSKATVTDKVNSLVQMSKNKYSNATVYYFPGSKDANAGIIPSGANKTEYGPFPSDVPVAGGILLDSIMSPSGSDRPFTGFTVSDRNYGIKIGGTFTTTYGKTITK